jgi:hypothetical protein
MKPKTFLIICLCFLIQESYGQAVDTLTASNGKYKKVKSKLYNYCEQGFCSTSTHLNSDSTFLWESGCEGKTTISIGFWKILGDSIEFISTKKNELNLIYHVQTTNSKPKRKTTIYLFDKTGKPLESLSIIPLKKNENYLETDHRYKIMDQDSNEIEQFFTDKFGKVIVNFSTNPFFEIKEINDITQGHYRISTKGLGSEIKIYLNTNIDALFPDHNYEYLWRESYRTIFKDFKQAWGN